MAKGLRLQLLFPIQIATIKAITAHLKGKTYNIKGNR